MLMYTSASSDFFDAFIGVTFVWECILLFYVLPTFCSSSTHSALPFSKAGYLRKSSFVLLTVSTKTALLDVYLLYLLLPLLIRESVKVFLEVLFHHLCHLDLDYDKIHEKYQKVLLL